MASAIQRGIVAIDARGRMTHIKTEVNGKPWCGPGPSSVSARLISGDPVWTERLLFEDNSQVKVPPACDFVKFAPLNFKVETFDVMAWDDVEKFYTIPFYQTSLVVDEVVQGVLLACFRRSSAGALREALEKVGVWQSQGRWSLSTARVFFGAIVGVTVLRHARSTETLQGYVRCSCPLFRKHAQCAHELYVRFLEGDSDLHMFDLARLAQGRGTQDAFLCL